MRDSPSGRKSRCLAKELERENATLKRIVADKELEVVALKEIAKGRMKGQVLPGVIAVAARAWRCQSAMVCS
jgi:hypothetical protein